MVDNTGTGHVRYQHHHRVMPGLYVSIARRNSASHYSAYFTDPRSCQTVALVLEVGLWPSLGRSDQTTHTATHQDDDVGNPDEINAAPP
ncbi:hypothetical protein NUW54_g9100 [Trametes sanguinea]|uniref:Uncharacterized protein n=1 Tax=Trametes sanguinea TaxID=158606 RepID=A0ACC1PB62_9APHY|nr:hypothetical protein NUW54_g9100 [Trametes sanguinea]